MRRADLLLSSSYVGRFSKRIALIRFLTAKPVRTAFARMILLSQENPPQNLTTQLQSFVDRDLGDYVVVSVAFETTDQKVGSQLIRLFTTITTDALKEEV